MLLEHNLKHSAKYIGRFSVYSSKMSGFESDFEPFSGDSSDNYEPGDDASSDDDIPVVLKKRKVRNEKSWQRNVRKNLKAEGKAHTNYKNRPAPPRSTGKDCHCKYKCFEKIPVEKRVIIIENFNKIGNKMQQDIYLCGLITAAPINHKRSAGTRKGCSYKYEIRTGTFQCRVCKKGFCALHGISLKRVERLATHLFKGAVTAPLDKRGKHNNRPNAVPDDILRQIDMHVKSFPRRTSHYSRASNIKKYYLSPELNIKKMHELYLEKFEPEVFQYWFTDEKNDHKPKVSYDFYFRFVKANFNISFAHPRSDTCKTCDKIDTRLKNKALLSDEEIKALETELQLHQSKAKVFFDELKKKSELAKTEPIYECLCFDHQQNAPMPKVPSNDAFYLRQLWMYNFCIHSSKTGMAHFYMYDEITARKTPNETISFLNHYFDKIIGKDVKILYIFSDNCGAQNKNNALIQYLYSLVKTGRFEKIVHRFPEPAHSFLPCDRCFGVVEKHIRKIERVYLPVEYMKHYKNSSPKHFHVVPVTQEMIFNFSDSLSGYFKKTIKNKEKENFTISKYKVIEYSKEHVDEIRCCKLMNFTQFSSFVIQRNLKEVPALTNIPVLYNMPLRVKKKKYDNVMILANEYVPLADIVYYRKLTSDEQLNVEETDFTDDAEDISE